MKNRFTAGRTGIKEEVMFGDQLANEIFQKGSSSFAKYTLTYQILTLKNCNNYWNDQVKNMINSMIHFHQSDFQFTLNTQNQICVHVC